MFGNLATGATFVLTEVDGVATMATVIGAAAATLLLGAFGVGGGFRLAKKAYSWVMGKI